MALSRHREPSAFDRMSEDFVIPAAPQATGRAATDAERQRLWRRGHRSVHGKGHLDPVWEEPRNGLPVRLYVYRGTGRDLYDGTCLFEEIAS